jgi:hypothetical protein
MNLPAITALLRNEVAPRDPIQFVTVLKAAVKFPSLDGAELSMKDFRSFYDALLMYKREFLLYYDFMALPDLSNVPGTDDKELGIISLFTDPIPNDYGHKIAAVIRRERESLPRDDRKFRDLHQFVASFMKRLPKISRPGINTELCSITSVVRRRSLSRNSVKVSLISPRRRSPPQMILICPIPIALIFLKTRLRIARISKEVILLKKATITSPTLETRTMAHLLTMILMTSTSKK